MKEFSNFVTFKVQNTYVNLLKLDLDNKINHIVAEIDKSYYHLGDQEVSLETAKKAYDLYMGKDFRSNDESS